MRDSLTTCERAMMKKVPWGGKKLLTRLRPIRRGLFTAADELLGRTETDGLAGF
jgi:hypothetical protein